MSMTEKLYDPENREAIYTDHYSNHVSHMTSESLHRKSDIAVELAHRDMQIEALQSRVADLESRAKKAEAALVLAQREIDRLLDELTNELR